MAQSSTIQFFFEKRDFTLKDRTALKSFIKKIFKKERTMLRNLNYIFCSDKRLLEINREFLGHDYFTDIITFDLSEGKEKEAEIYISTDRVRENAKKLGHSFKSELHRVLFHGVLHLCGYSDKTAEGVLEMRRKEDMYVNQYFSLRST